MQALSVRFRPLEWNKNLGHLEFVPVEVSAQELLNNGYMPLHPYQFELVEYPLQEIPEGGTVENLPKWCGAALSRARYVCDWWQSAAFEEKGVNHQEYARLLSSELQRYSTVTFPTSLPATVSEIVRFTKADDTVVIRKGATYEDIVELALQRMGHPQVWNKKFIEKLIYRIGTGLEDDSIMADLTEVRAVLKELKPEIKLRSWADFRALDLPALFTPEDFREMEDVVVSVILDEKIVEFEAFVQAFTVPKADDRKVAMLHWNIVNPSHEKVTWDKWLAKFGGVTGQHWRVASSNGEVILEPEAGRTMVEIREEMRRVGLDTTRTVPYHMCWDEFENQLTRLDPGEIDTGVQIVCDTNLPKILRFEGAPSFRDLTVDIMQRMCQTYGLERGKDKDETWENLMALVVHEYPKFDRAMREAMNGQEFIRVVNFEKNPPERDSRRHDLKSRVFDLQNVVAGKHEQPILIQFMLSIFLLAHSYSSMIVRSDYVTTLFTLEGILEGFKEVGYIGEEGNKTFYYMTSGCQLPLSLPKGILEPVKGLTDTRTKADLNVEGADQLIADILGD